MELNKGIDVSAGRVRGMIYGGSFRDYDPKVRRIVGVKLAKEIESECDVDVSCNDYGTPKVKAMNAGLIKMFTMMANGEDAYAGCMGGKGRTGTYMCCAQKALSAYKGQTVTTDNLIKHVREVYDPHAVETPQQRAFIESYDPTPVVMALRAINGDKPKVAVVKKMGYVGLALLFCAALYKFLPALIEVLKALDKR